MTKTIRLVDIKKAEFKKVEFYLSELKAQIDLDSPFVPGELLSFVNMMKMIKEIHDNLDKIAQHIRVEIKW